MAKLSKVAEAYDRSRIARQALREMDARSMEVTEDKCGIVWERFIVHSDNGAVTPVKATNVILFATPEWWEVFVPLTEDPTNDGTIAALKALARR